MWRRIWVKALQMFCHDHFPRMLATKLSSASFVRRQRDGLAVGVAGLAADCGRSTGGRVRDLPGILLGNQEGDQLGVDPSLCKFRFLGCQLVKSGQAFHSLEGQFELPAEAIKREHILLLTALPASVFPATDELALYLFLWQLELAFKRMKSLAGLVELTAKKPELAQAWIYAKLIAFPIAEQNAGQVPDSPPCGPATVSRQPSHPHRKSIALASDKAGAGQLCGQHSRKVVVAKHL